jgi:predicted Zn-dependent peptidase
VRNVYDDSYAAAHAHLYVSGNFIDAVAEKSIRESFSDWTVGVPTQRKSAHASIVHELATIDVPGAARSVTWIGLPVSDPTDRGFAALEVADMLVGGYDSSRVALDIASIEHAAPKAASTIWQRHAATYWVSVIDVHTANTGAALGALVGELSVLKKEAPGEEEVARARRRVMAAFDAKAKSREGIVSLMEFMEEHGLDEAWRSGYDARVVAVTPEDVRAAVAKQLDPAHMAIAVAGDRETIEPQLARLRPLVP